jgi:L-ascorbate metabolism protein UlaG (beta-lactamase superfamily)
VNDGRKLRKHQNMTTRVPDLVASVVTPPPSGRIWRVVRRVFGGVGIVIGVCVLVLLVESWQALGHGADGARRLRVQQSPRWHAGVFTNPEPLVNDMASAFLGMLDRSPAVTPVLPLPIASVEPERFDTAPASGLRVTWFGHSSALVEIDGHQVLTDPAWSDRASPSIWVGPERWYPPPFEPRRLQRLERVLISHDHYDHLDRGTILTLLETPAKFVVPLGVGAHLAYWGVPEDRIVELDWWQKETLGDLELVCTPARHASGRHILDKDHTLWAGYALVGPKHRVYFSGDTGLFRSLLEIGERLGPFDLTMIEVGQYNPSWPDWHIGPEQALKAHHAVRGKVFLPIHWGLFTLAYHGWTEPIERVFTAAPLTNTRVVAPRPGQSIEPDLPFENERWWPDLPWKDAGQAPIVSGNAF